MSLYLRALEQAVAIAGNCSDYTSCNSCLDRSSCKWCAATGICLEDSENTCSDDVTNTCSSPEYIVIIFVVILVVLVCLCFGTCYWRKFRGFEEEMIAPLLPQQARNFLWRNSLQDQGESEWMCVICGFDNKPRAKFCIMCGTSYKFTMDYKLEKSEKKKLKKKKMEGKKQQKSFFSRNTVINKLHESEESDMDNVVINTENDITITDAFPPATPTKRDLERSIIASPDIQAVLESSTAPSRSSLSFVRRREALNYRRLNQLSLRQKSARRRKMWQRQYDPNTGSMVWVRASVKETMIGSAPFGYSPSASFCEPSSATSLAAISQSVPFGRSQRVDSGSSNSMNHDRAAALVDAALGRPSRAKSETSSKDLNDSFGDPVLLSSSPGFTSRFDEDGGLNWEKVESRRAGKPKARAAPAAASSSSAAVAGGTGDCNSSTALIGEEKTYDYPLNIEDLESVAAMTFREKQLWFLNYISKLQKPWSEGCVVMDLHRERVLEESHKAIMSITNTGDLHKWLRIQFIGEPGIDAGGLEREWFDMIAKGLTAPATGLFINGLSDSSGGSYHINPLSGQFNSEHLSYFRFAGRVFGKAIMEQQPIPASLSLPIRKQMLGLPITFSDLEFVDAELHRNLLYIQNTTGVEILSLDFTVTYEAFGKKATYELVPNGENILVTDQNRDEYLLARLKHRMLDSIKPQLEMLLKGLYEVLPTDLLSVFDYQELELLMCGIPDIDVSDWMRHTEYLAEYHQHGARHKVIRWFWLAVEAMSPEERIRLLQFTTGCSRVPAQGFKALQSHDGHYRKFNIQSIKKVESLYPRAHTCFNKLDLPVYDSQSELDAYLSVVINMEITGFSME